MARGHGVAAASESEAVKIEIGGQPAGRNRKRRILKHARGSKRFSGYRNRGCGLTLLPVSKFGTLPEIIIIHFR